MHHFLAGPEPPKWFDCDGCSAGAPQKAFGVDLGPLCRRHDFGYYKGRVWYCCIHGTWALGKDKPYRNLDDGGLMARLKSPHTPDVYKPLIEVEIERLKSRVMHERTTADVNLRTNIVTVYRRKAVALKADGKRLKAKLAKAQGKIVANLYFSGVFTMGHHSIDGPGHEGNFARMNAEATAEIERIMTNIRNGYKEAV